MTDPMHEVDDDDEDQEPDESTAIQDLRRQNRKLAKQLKERGEADARAEKAEKALWLRDAAEEINLPKGPQTRWFLRKYDGDMSNEALMTEAREAGILAIEEPKANSAEVDALQRLTNAESAPPSGETDWNALIYNAQTPEEVMEIAAKAGVPTKWNRPE